MAGEIAKNHMNRGFMGIINFVYAGIYKIIKCMLPFQGSQGHE